MSEWQVFGPHRYRVSEGIFWIETRGVATLVESQILIDDLLTWHRGKEECGMLIDVRGGLEMPAASRQMVARSSQEAQLLLPVAVIGAGLTARAVLTLLMAAIRLVRKHDTALKFFDDEAEAVSWLKIKMAERGARMRALKASL